MKSDSENRESRKVFTEPVRRPDHIASYFRREWKTLLIVAVSGTLFNMGQSLCAIRQGALVDAIAGGQGIFVASCIFLLTVLAVQLLRLAKRYYVRRFANAADISMRMMVYNHIIHEDYRSLRKENSGQVMTRALGDVDRTVEGMRKVTTEVFDTGVLLCTYFVTMMGYSVKCTLLSVIPVPFALLAARFLKVYVEKYNRKARDMNAKVAQSSLDSVRNSLLYRVTGSAGRVAARYEEELAELEADETAAGILENSMQPVYNAITLCGALTVIFYGGRLVLGGSWTVGAFTAYLTIYLAFALKVAKVSKLFNSYQKAKVSWARVKPYLTGWKEEKEDSGEGKAAPDGVSLAASDHIRSLGLPTSITLMCRDVSVTGEGKRDLLAPVSFAGRKGQIIGITGPVGCGKSLLGLALAGLGDYKGSIKVEGHELSILSGQEKTKLISYMGHDPQLANLSLKDNILLGRPSVPGRLREVLEDVCLDRDLLDSSLSEGIPEEKTGQPDIEELAQKRLSGSGGKALSGGQRARIACARALYAHSPLIILDEPFANVDKDTEAKMIEGLIRHHQDSVIVIISHRMKVFEKANLILMIEDTGFVKTGSHEELMKESKRYRDSFTMQNADAEKNAGGESHEDAE